MVSRFLITIIAVSFSVGWANGQSPLTELPLTRAYELLENRYPLLENGNLIKSVLGLETEAIDKGSLPSVYLKADSRLQSESASLDLPEGTVLPFQIDVPLYSAKTYLEAQYTILDGNMADAQKRLKEAQAKADLQGLEVDRFALKERVNKLFINIILLREQSKLFDISIEDLKARKEKIEAGVDEGVLLQSDLNKIKVRELELAAQQDNLSFKLTGLVQSLSYLIGQEIDENAELQLPNMANPKAIPNIDRPEQKLFQLQQQTILANNDLIDASLRPRLVTYAQAGAGYPNPLNFLDNNFAPFGVVGLQFNWKITDWRKADLDREKLSLQTMKLKNAEETFEFNLQSADASYLAEIDRLSAQLEHDDKIAELQSDILTQMAVQLDEGVITSAEYITQVNAELAARQNMLIHRVERKNAQLEFWNKRGGL